MSRWVQAVALGATIVLAVRAHAERPRIVPPVTVTSADCQHCHGKRTGVVGRQPVIDEDEIAQSVHGGKVECVDCHVGVGVDAASHRNAKTPVECTRCHGNSVSKAPPRYRGRSDSIHSRPRRKGSHLVPTCKSCHGTHDILPPQSPQSKVNRANIRRTCGECHAKPASDAPQIAVKYDQSIHGRAHNQAGEVAATCTDCHLPHHPGETASTRPIRKADIPGICGRCHEKIFRQYRETIHGRELLQRGNTDVPACTDCHGEHTIRKPSDKLSSVNPLHVVKTCTKCHENKQLQRRYGLPADRAATYRQSYHGISNNFGDIRAANCATCHTAHNILPASDPRSSVNPNNLQRTCGQAGCHKGSTERFRSGTVHLAPSAKSEAMVYWIGAVYKLLVALFVVFFGLTIALDVMKRAMLRLTAGGGNR